VRGSKRGESRVVVPFEIHRGRFLPSIAINLGHGKAHTSHRQNIPDTPWRLRAMQFSVRVRFCHASRD